LPPYNAIRIMKCNGIPFRKCGFIDLMHSAIFPTQSVIRDYGIQRLREMAARKAKVSNNPTVCESRRSSFVGEHMKLEAAASQNLTHSSRTGSIGTLGSLSQPVADMPLVNGPANNAVVCNVDRAQQKNEAASPGISSSVGPEESLTRVLSRLRSRRPFQVTHPTTMPFIDEDSSADHAVDGELDANNDVAETDTSISRNAYIDRALRQVAAVSSMPIFKQLRRRRLRNQVSE
jgi:hypothetical protein